MSEGCGTVATHAGVHIDSFKISNLQEVSAREHDSHTGMIWLSNSESFEELMRDSGVIVVREPAHFSKSVTKLTNATYVSFRGCSSSNTRGFIDFPNFKGDD